MSLTSELRNPDSKVSGFFREYANPEAVGRLTAAINERVSRIAPAVVADADPISVGRAFDYAFRWRVRSFSAGNKLDYKIALVGALNIAREDAIEELVRIGAADALRPACCVALGYFEEVYRSGKVAPLLRQPMSRLIEQLKDAPDARDVAVLEGMIPIDLLAPAEYTANPIFEGSRDVGGADGDWIIDGTLYDCKCSRKYRPMQTDYVWQMLGYVLLDYTDRYHISRIGWYFARQAWRITFDLTGLLQKIFYCHDLEWLRSEFKKAVNL